jgi:hypothetical protein
MITIYDVNGGDSVSLLPSELIEYLEQKDREGKKVLSLAPELLKMCQEIENTELDYDNNKIDLILPLRLGLNNNVYVAKTVSTTYQIGVDQFIKDIREFVVSEKYSAVFPIYVYDVDPAKSGHFVGLFLEKPSESEDIKGIYFDPRGCEDQYFSDDQLREVEEILMMNLGKYYRSLELSKTKIQAYSEFEPNNNCGVFVIEVLSNMADNWTRCIDGNLQSSSGGKVTPLLDYPPEISNHLGKEFRKGHSELIKNNHKLIKINIPSQQKPLPFLRNILYPFSQVIAGIEYEKKSR